MGRRDSMKLLKIFLARIFFQPVSMFRVCNGSLGKNKKKFIITLEGGGNLENDLEMSLNGILYQ